MSAPAPPPKKPIITPAIWIALIFASAPPRKCSAAMPSFAMSCVALASDATASRPTAQPAVATVIPICARLARHSTTMHCIGSIQLRRRPIRADQRLSTTGAHRNLTTHGSPTSGRNASACSGAPSWRSKVGIASIAMPIGMPCDR
ncbi:putative transporter domain protein [Burkholderia pseudomallei MSHR3016]|nr:putative transporter domain protein [Burkholderia pseudomallei MSHR3016]